MSRGLGPVERKILEYLARDTTKIQENGSAINDKIKGININIYMPKTSSIEEIVTHTKKSYQSVTRAVRNLEDKDLVISWKMSGFDVFRLQILFPEFDEEIFNNMGPKKSSWIKMVTLSKYSMEQLKKSPNVNKYVFNLTEFLNQKKSGE